MKNKYNYIIKNKLNNKFKIIIILLLQFKKIMVILEFLMHTMKLINKFFLLFTLFLGIITFTKCILN